jgi:hypothetical protein
LQLRIGRSWVAPPAFRLRSSRPRTRPPLNEHQPGPSDHFELTIGPTHVDADGCESHSYELNLYNWLGQWRCAPFNETPICFG